MREPSISLNREKSPWNERVIFLVIYFISVGILVIVLASAFYSIQHKMTVPQCPNPNDYGSCLSYGIGNALALGIVNSIQQSIDRLLIFTTLTSLIPEVTILLLLIFKDTWLTGFKYAKKLTLAVLFSPVITGLVGALLVHLNIL